jgi:hypothetical protein
VHRFNSTLQPTYLKAIEMPSVPVVTVGVVMAVSTPVVGLIAYIDTVLLPELVTYAKVPAEFTAIAPG